MYTCILIMGVQHFWPHWQPACIFHYSNFLYSHYVATKYAAADDDDI